MANGGVISAEGLTPKQQAFADHYLQSFNATEAARQAGYSISTETTIGTIAWENMQKPAIISYLTKKTQSIAQKVEREQVDAYNEWLDSLELLRELRIRCKEWLTVNGTMTLEPRAEEIRIVYHDPREKTATRWPKQQTATLQQLIDMVTGDQVLPKHSHVTSIDMRKFVLEVIDRIDANLDKFAKIAGTYTNPKTNPADNVATAKQLALELMANHGKSEEDAREYAAKRYGVLESDLLTK